MKHAFAARTHLGDPGPSGVFLDVGPLVKDLRSQAYADDMRCVGLLSVCFLGEGVVSGALSSPTKRKGRWTAVLGLINVRAGRPLL